MLNRKLLEVLSRLNPNEAKRLRLFLQSPYFNNAHQPEVLVNLCDYIMQYLADETHPMLAKSVVFKIFFPDKPYIEGEKNSLDGLMSRLFGLVRSFLAEEQVHRNPIETEYRELFVQLQFYRKHGLEERFWQASQSIRKNQQDWPHRDAEYFHRQFHLSEEIAAFKTLSNSFQDDANLGTTSTYLDTYYSIKHMEMVCALQYQQQTSQNEMSLDTSQMESILALARKGGFADLPLIKIYRLIFDLLRNPDNQGLHDEFEVLLENSKKGIPIETLSNLKAYQRYFWIRHYTQSGDHFYRLKLFELYKEHFEEGYFYVDGSITVNSLRMLLVFALKLGHFDWVKQILDDHPPERICGTRYPAEAFSLNLAEYHFYKKEYAEAIDKLQYRLFENPNLSVMADVLLIKIYFETQDDLLDSRMKALEQKVRRTKISGDSKIRYSNFIKKLDKIIRQVWDGKGARYEKMVRELKSIPNIIEREWLLEKLQEKSK